MLKAVVGTPDSSGLVKATVHSGPTIPDTFIFPVSTPVTQFSTIQNHQNALPSILDQKYNDEMALENAKYDQYMNTRHNADTQFSQKLAELRQVYSKYLQKSPYNGVKVNNLAELRQVHSKYLHK